MSGLRQAPHAGYIYPIISHFSGGFPLQMAGLLSVRKSQAAGDSRAPRRFAHGGAPEIPPGLGVRLSSAALDFSLSVGPTLAVPGDAQHPFKLLPAVAGLRRRARANMNLVEYSALAARPKNE